MVRLPRIHNILPDTDSSIPVTFDNIRERFDVRVIVHVVTTSKDPSITPIVKRSASLELTRAEAQTLRDTLDSFLKGAAQ